VTLTSFRHKKSVPSCRPHYSALRAIHRALWLTLGSPRYTQIAPWSTLSSPCCSRISPCSTLSAECCSRISPRSSLSTRTGRELLRARHLAFSSAPGSLRALFRSPCAAHGSLRAQHLAPSELPADCSVFNSCAPHRSRIAPRSTRDAPCCLTDRSVLNTRALLCSRIAPRSPLGSSPRPWIAPRTTLGTRTVRGLLRARHLTTYISPGLLLTRHSSPGVKLGLLHLSHLVLCTGAFRQNLQNRHEVKILRRCLATRNESNYALPCFALSIRFRKIKAVDCVEITLLRWKSPHLARRYRF
jgi:hypothetical protein